MSFKAHSEELGMFVGLEETTGMIAMKAGRMSFPNYVYTVFDSDTRDAVIVDPGWEGEALLAAIGALGLKVRGVLLSHSHADHVAEASVISAKAECPVFMSRDEVDATGFDCDRLQLVDSETPINLGSVECRPILTPGHTVGSVCYSIGSRLFTGDTLFMEGVGLCTTPDGRPADLFRSLEKFRNTIAEETRVYPGHKYTLELGLTFTALKKSNVYMQLTREAAFLSFCERSVRKRNTPPKIGTEQIMKPLVECFHPT